MVNNRELQSKPDFERIGRIRTLKSLEKGDQVKIYYSHITSKVELHIEKFDSHMTESANLSLSMYETKQLIELLEDSIDRAESGEHLDDLDLIQQLNIVAARD
jgi:hypothetical protein